MAVPVFTDYVAGNTLTWADIAANMALGRTWINGLGDGDFAAGEIRSEHLVRPVITPFDSFESTFQGLWGVEFGNLGSGNHGSLGPGSDGRTKLSWGAMIERVTIIPSVVPVDSWWATPIGATVFLPQSSHVKANLSLEFLPTNKKGGGGTSYPDGAGAGDLGGRLCWMRRDRSTGDTTEETASVIPVYPGDTAAIDRKPQSGHAMMYEQLSAGTYDIFLAYRRTAAATLQLYQIDLSRIVGTIEAG